MDEQMEDNDNSDGIAMRDPYGHEEAQEKKYKNVNG